MAKPLQVLVLEDRPSDAELIIKQLTRDGYAPDWKRVDTEREFRQCLTPSLELIIMDYTLPAWSAPDALRVLGDTGSDVPVIVVSGSVGEERAVDCLLHGATDYVMKDRMTRLGPAVRRALEDRRLHRQKVKADEALRRSEDQLRSILFTIEDVVWSLSLETGRLLYVNPAAEKLTGRPIQEFLDDPRSWLAGVHPDDHSVMAQAQEAAVRWGTYEGEFRLVRPDRTIRKVLVRAWAAYAGGKPERLEGIFTDVTDKRLAEQERIELEWARRESTRLGQVNQFKSDLLSMVAHDLNNVMTPLKINAFVLTGKDDLGPENREKARAGLEHAVQRIGEFMADLLDAARLQSGQLAILRRTVDVAACLHRAIDPLQPEAQRKGIRLALEAPESLMMEADERRLEQVFTNLIGNALKFTPAGGRVAATLGQVPAGIVITVQDTGQGLAQDDVGKLFQPFARVGTQPQGVHTGTGLGLYICRGIVEAHGGTISVQSPGPGKGSSFCATFPQPG